MSDQGTRDVVTTGPDPDRYQRRAEAEDQANRATTYAERAQAEDRANRINSGQA